MENKWKFDLDKTKERYHKLSEYYNSVGLNANNFSCKNKELCKNFAKKDGIEKQFQGGTCSLPPFYDISYDGKSCRVMIVGKENGYMKNKKYGTSDDFDDNTLNVLNCIGWDKKNNHIKGTLMILENIYGVNTDYLYSSFVLSNLMRCSYQSESCLNNVSNVNSTKTMRISCLPHLIKEIEILEPNLIIFQGEWSLEIVKELQKHYNLFNNKIMSNSNDKYGLYDFNNFMLMTTHHPAILGNWIKNLAPDSVWPFIKYLKDINYLPKIDESIDNTGCFISLTKDYVDNLLENRDSNNILRK